MNQQEMEQAKLLPREVHARIAEDAKVSAKLVLADVGAWRSATDAYVAEHNMIIKNAAVGRSAAGDRSAQAQLRGAGQIISRRDGASRAGR